MRQYVFKLK